MVTPLSEFEAQVALAEMIVKLLLAKEDFTKPRVSSGGLVCGQRLSPC